MEYLEEKLISEVQARPVLYSKELDNYRKTSIRDELWKEVADAVGCDVDTCKRRWRSLRDAFLKNYRSTKQTTNTSSGWRRKRWAYYDMLLFLAPHVESRETSTNQVKCNFAEEPCKPEPNSPTDDGSEIFLETHESISEDAQPETDDYDATTSERSRSPNFSKRIKKNTEDKFTFLSGNDPDEHFLLSLLPSLKRMTSQQNSLSRIRMQQVLYEIEFGDLKGCNCTNMNSANKEKVIPEK